MTVKYIREDRVPAGAVGPQMNPAYKHLNWARKEEIIKRYMVADKKFRSIASENGEYSTNIIFMFFESVEKVDQFKDEMAQFGATNMSTNIDPDHRPAAQGITSRYQLRDTDSDVVLRDWVPFTTGP